MKLHTLVSAATLSLVLGGTGLVLAQERQEPHPEEARPTQNEARPEQPRQENEAKHDQSKPENKGDIKPERQDKQDKKEMEQEKKNNEKEQKQTEPEHSQRMDHDSRQLAPARQAGNHEERAGARSGERIPDEKFHSNFGRQHTFVVHKTMIVQGQPRFQYSGYWFTLIDVWPADWAYTDDCYIDYIDGEYFLFNMLHPGMRIAVFVVM